MIKFNLKFKKTVKKKDPRKNDKNNYCVSPLKEITLVIKF